MNAGGRIVFISAHAVKRGLRFSFSIFSLVLISALPLLQADKQ